MSERPLDARIRRVGRCASCDYARTITSAKNSEFWLCRRAVAEPSRFAKYPRLPVIACSGWAPAQPAAEREVDPG